MKTNLLLQNVTADELAEIIIKKLGAQFPEPTKKSQPEYLTRRQLADELSVDLATIHRWGKEGILPSYRMGGRVYFKHSDVEACMKARPNLKDSRRKL